MRRSREGATVIVSCRSRFPFVPFLASADGTANAVAMMAAAAIIATVFPSIFSPGLMTLMTGEDSKKTRPQNIERHGGGSTSSSIEVPKRRSFKDSKHPTPIVRDLAKDIRLSSY